MNKDELQEEIDAQRGVVRLLDEAVHDAAEEMTRLMRTLRRQEDDLESPLVLQEEMEANG